MKNTLLNHDCFNTWQTCRTKYYYKYIKGLKYPEFYHDYELGQSVHALIDYHLRGLKTDHLLQNADMEIISLWNAIKKHSILKKKVIKTEWGINIPIKTTPYWLTGRVDAVFFDEKTGKYIISDWKTGKFIPQKIQTNFQHKIYLYAFYQARKDLGLNFKPEDVVFKYFKILPDDIEITDIAFSEDKLIEYEENFIKIAKNIENYTDIEISEICPAKICEYKRICNK